MLKKPRLTFCILGVLLGLVKIATAVAGGLAFGV